MQFPATSVAQSEAGGGLWSPSMWWAGMGGGVLWEESAHPMAMSWQTPGSPTCWRGWRSISKTIACKANQGKQL